MTASLPNWEEWTTSGAWAAKDTRTLPMSPGLLGEALALVRDPDADVARLIRFASRDQAVAARVLRMANVAAFAPMVEVTSIHQAVVRLGTEAVRHALLAVCFASWAQPAGADSKTLKALVAHGIVVGTFARHVAGAAATDTDESFTQGLLHDIGKLFLLRLRGDYVRQGGTLPSEDELAASDQNTHAVVGALAMQLWGLPLVLREPIEWHHTPLDAPTHPRATAVIYVANALAHRYGEGHERSLEFAGDPAMVGLGLGDAWLEQTDAQSARLLESADRIITHC